MPALMKGKVWADRRDAKDRRGHPIVQYPLLVEPKVDEIRCQVLVHRQEESNYLTVKYLSYAGKPLANMQCFDDVVMWVADEYAQYELDIGVQVNANFNDSYRFVRSTKGVPDDLIDAKLVLHLYDLPLSIHQDYCTRKVLMQTIAQRSYSIHGGVLRVLPHYRAYDPVRVEQAFENFLRGGYEGAMAKRHDYKYNRKRSDDWLKLKPDADADGIIQGIEEAVCGKDQPEKGLKVGDPLGRAGAVRVRCEDGSYARPHGIPHELGRDMLLHPEEYIGQWCEFKYMERDRQGGYRHPTFHRIREAKE